MNSEKALELSAIATCIYFNCDVTIYEAIDLVKEFSRVVE